MTREAPGALVVTTDLARMGVAAVHAHLSGESYRAPGVPLETVRRSMENSLRFAVLDGARQIAFARVITDRATFAYLCDVYLDPDRRGLATEP